MNECKFSTEAGRGIHELLDEYGKGNKKPLEEAIGSTTAAFDPEYIKNAIIPALLSQTYNAGVLPLPMIATSQTKQNALPKYLWGTLYDNWQPPTASEVESGTGTTVFLTGLENRGANNSNLRKRIYFSAVTPDLYEPMYKKKVAAFWDRLLDPSNAGKPFIQLYLDAYPDLYWDLHVGVTGGDVPDFTRQIGSSFNTVLSYQNPKETIVYNNYMAVRALRPQFFDWLNEKIQAVELGKVPAPEKTFVHYWLRNSHTNEAVFTKSDIAFECFHNFVALSQWAHTVYLIIQSLSEDPRREIAACYLKLMKSEFDRADDSPYTPLTRFVMELFRIYSPNDASISSPTFLNQFGTNKFKEAEANLISVPHKATSTDPTHWHNPDQFDPDRYLRVPSSAQVGKAKSKEMGFAQCPFDLQTFKVKDGRDVSLANSAFGTVYGVAEGKPMPVCDYAGFAPFGFGYRRCPGEQFTQAVIADFLRAMMHKGITFKNLNLIDPAYVPAGPGEVVPDQYGFSTGGHPKPA